MANLMPYAFRQQLKSLFFEIKKVGPIENWEGQRISSPEEFVTCLLSDSMKHPWVCKCALGKKPGWVFVEKTPNALHVRSNARAIDRVIYLPSVA